MRKQKKLSIVTRMRLQHDNLQNELTEIARELESVSPDFSIIVTILYKFRDNLVEHLDLEDRVFYPTLLEKMRMQGKDTSSIEKLTTEMSDIEGAATIFLSKYKDALLIKENFDSFKKDLHGIIQALNLRINTEEKISYSYWEKIKKHHSFKEVLMLSKKGCKKLIKRSANALRRKKFKTSNQETTLIITA